jgi:hypothetical protein
VTERADVIVAGKSLRPGETQEILLKISEFYTANPVNIPVTVMRGTEDGPRVFLTAAIHGDELNGVEIVRSVIQGLDHSKIKGTLICLPVINRMGFLNHSRYLPDRTDLNRHFPGDPSGNAASRIAHILFKQVVGHCDFGIDFHGFISSAAFDTINLTFRGFPDTESEPGVADFVAFDEVTFNTAPTRVPEPTSLVLLGAGLAALGFRKRRA